MFTFLKKKRLKLICFDIDNTLVDYGMAESEAEAHISKMLSKSTGKNVMDILRTFNGIKNACLHHDMDPKSFSRRLWVEKTLKLLDVKSDIKKSIDTGKIEKAYWDYLVPRMRLFPNTLHVLESLKSSGNYRIACLTDSDGDKEIKIRRLKHLGIEKYFDYIITTDDTGKNKPSIENWEYLLKMSGMKGSQCMMVGDHPEVDLVNAKKLGFVTVWTKEHIPVDAHMRYIDYEINDIGEILEIIKKYS